ncbi:DNA-directed RNA polymerase I subunit RPA12 [Planococcus citri]|uniref:DNA-directed RNA polymerase I subunit RPA12 n=1 Tax=Planococcus citri TaxID=170843 RepID=UPI0031FA29EB
MFRVHSGFCTDCGSVLPDVGITDVVTCYSCKKRTGVEIFKGMESKYVVHFNSVENMNIAKKTKKRDEGEADGPIAERTCRRCGHNQMSYAAMQLRSADEGQTVFYTCLKCKHTESENS